MTANETKPSQNIIRAWLSSMSGRMALTFCTLTLLVLLGTNLTEMFGLPFGLFQGEINIATSQKLNNLSSIADFNKKLLELWLSERRGDASAISQSPFLARMTPAPGHAGTTQNSVALAEWLDVISYSYRYDSVRILEPLSGKTIISSKGGQAAPPLPAAILNRAQHPGYDDIITLTAASASHPPRLHIIRRIARDRNQNKTPALLLDLAMDFESALKLLWDNNQLGTTGKSGETVVVNGNNYFFADTRHPLADRNSAVPLPVPNQWKPARLAIEGGDGTVIAPDYRGVTVLAAYRHIPVTPEMSLGLVVKLDEKEALEPVIGKLRVTMVFMAIASAIILLGTFVIARRLSRPLQKIARAAGEIEAGDLTRRVPLEGSSETIALGHSFNTMVQQLAHSQENLEQTVKSRTEELQKLSTRQEAILAAVPDIIMEVDRNRVYTWGNSAGLEFFGDEAIGREAAYYFEGEQDTYEKTQPLIDGKIDVIYVESWQRRKDGRIRLLAWWCKALKDEQGNGIGGLSTARDITETRNAEEERRKLESQLLQAQKLESIGRLAGGVAHDFNNMLSVILGHAELGMMRLDPTHPAFAKLKEIGRTAERSADLTRQLLAFARKQTVSPKVIDLNETVNNMLKMLKRLIGEDIVLTWRPSQSPCHVKMDPSQVDQILANLCVNARDAIKDTGQIIVETGLCSVDSDFCATNPDALPGNYVRLVVSDNGIGMVSETLEHIFEPFYTTKELGKGTGLGLATVYGAIRQNNGFISTSSEPGRGTSFSIYLPQYEGQEIKQMKSDPAPSAPRGNETILLVEDEVAILNMASAMLESQGYKVLKAGTPGKAIELARMHPGEIQLLVTDVIMPEMNGQELARSIQSLQPGIKSLFMSGYTADIIAHHGVLDEDVHFIQKPFSLAKIATGVREVLDGR